MTDPKRFLGARQDRPLPWRLHVPLIASLPLALSLSAVAARHPELVETFYSQSVYPRVAGVLTWLFGWTPFAAIEGLGGLLVLLAATRLVLGLRAWRRGRRRLPNLAVHGLFQTLAVVAIGVFLFTVSWGLNYRRRPLADRLGLDIRPPAAEELAEMAKQARTELEGLAAQVPRNSDGTLIPLGSLAAARQGFAALPEALRGRAPMGQPKRLWASFLLYGTLSSGVFMPFTGESLVSRDIPAARLPSVAAHELAHQRGLAREDEASFLGLLACRAHPDPVWRYSGAFEAFAEIVAALAVADRTAYTAVTRGLPQGVLADYQESAAWRRRHSTRVAQLSKQVYDHYLKAQGQAAGIVSYRQVLLLMVGEHRRAQGRITAMIPGLHHD